MRIASPRVDTFMLLYAALSDEEQQMVRDMVALACSNHRRLLAERLAASVPFVVGA